MRPFRLLAAVTLAFGLIFVQGAAGLAQTAVHRRDVPAGIAAPTGGSFSIRFPVAFSDIEAKAAGEDADAAPVVVRMLTGTDGGIRFSATEMPFLPGKARLPMDDFMEATKKRPGASVSDVVRERKDDTEVLSFSLADLSGGTYFRIIRTGDAQYMQVIQFPESERSKASGMKDDFFNSFRLTRS